jgi:hypothetical protein
MLLADGDRRAHEEQVMGERRRLQAAGAVYLVSNVTNEGQAFITPCEAVNTIIENNLAWAADKRRIELYAYNFNPDSFFMIVGAPCLNLGSFMGDFQGLTARQINAHHGRTGRFFAGRYQCTRLLDDRAIIEALGRVLCGPCQADLVASPDDWGGVSSWKLHRSGEALVGQREDRARYREIRRADPDITDAEARRLATTTHTVELARLRPWSDKPHMDYHRAVCAIATDHAREITTARTRRCAGMDAVAGWPVTRRLGRQWRREALCRAGCARRKESFRRRYRDLNLSYEFAAAALRRGRTPLEFPHGMIPPHRRRAVGAPRETRAGRSSPLPATTASRRAA